MRSLKGFLTETLEVVSHPLINYSPICIKNWSSMTSEQWNLFRQTSLFIQRNNSECASATCFPIDWKIFRIGLCQRWALLIPRIWGIFSVFDFPPWLNWYPMHCDWYASYHSTPPSSTIYQRHVLFTRQPLLSCLFFQTSGQGLRYFDARTKRPAIGAHAKELKGRR